MEGKNEMMFPSMHREKTQTAWRKILMLQSKNKISGFYSKLNSAKWQKSFSQFNLDGKQKQNETMIFKEFLQFKIFKVWQASFVEPRSSQATAARRNFSNFINIQTSSWASS